MHFKRLKITNFGPIREIEFHFEKDKVYHFVGDNDSGKSMILDAMNILCHNIAGIHVKKYVSDFADSFHIEAEDFEGNIIELQRGDVSWYKLTLPNGEVRFYDKIGSGVPESIKKIVNVYEDELKKEKFNFRYSDDKILFMNTTPGENYSFFQKALRTDKVLNALRKANTLQNSLEKEIEITKSKISYEQEKLDKNPDISYVKEEIELYRKSIQSTMAKARLMYEIITNLEYLEELEKIMIPSEVVEFDWVKARETRNKISLSLDILNGLEKYSRINQAFEANKELLNERENVLEHHKIIKAISELIDIETKDKKLGEEIDKLADLSIELNKSKDYKDNLQDIISKMRLVKEIEVMQEKSEHLNNVLDSLDTIKDLIENRLSTHKTILTKTTELIEGLEELRDKTAQAQENKKLIEDIDNERSEFMRANNFCPVVANSLNKKCPFNGKSLEEIARGI